MSVTGHQRGGSSTDGVVSAWGDNRNTWTGPVGSVVPLRTRRPTSSSAASTRSPTKAQPNIRRGEEHVQGIVAKVDAEADKKLSNLRHEGRG
jgi:hypothetical protein